MRDHSLPNGWIECHLEDLISPKGVFKDGDWVESKDQDPNGEVRLIQLADIGDGSFANKSSRYLTLNKARQLNCTFLEKEDLLIARMPNPLGRCCIFPFDSEKKFVTVVDVCILRVGNKYIDHKYLMFLINSIKIREKISALQSGSTRKRISRKNLATINFPIAPLNEQKRIVAKIEKLFSELDNGIAALKTAQEQLKVYRQAILKHAFEGKLTAKWRDENADKLETLEQLLARIQQERAAHYQQELEEWKINLKEWDVKGKKGKKPVKPKELEQIASLSISDVQNMYKLPNGWVFLRLGTFIDKFDAGKSFKCDEREPASGEIGVAKVSAVTWGEYDETESKTCLDAAKVNPDYFIKSEDFILSRANTIELVGACVIARKITKTIMLSDKTLRINFTGINQEYVLQYLRSHYGRNEIMERSTGNQESMRNIGQDRIKDIIIPVCGRTEMDLINVMINEQLESISQFSMEVEMLLIKAETLRQSILKKAFSGHLVSQNSNDEPASELLTRIKAEISFKK